MKQTRRVVVRPWRRRKQKRRIRKLLFLAVAVFVVYFTAKNIDTTPAQAQTQGAQELSFLEQSFRATGATASGYELHDWSTVNHSFSDAAQLTQIGATLVQDLQLQNAKTMRQSNSAEDDLEIDGTWPNQTAVHVVLTSFAPTLTVATGTTSADSGSGSAPGATAVSSSGSSGTAAGMDMVSGSTVLVISVTSKGHNLQPFAAEYEQMQSAIRGVQATPQISACLLGFRDDKMVGVHADALATQALQANHAVPLGGLRSTLETSLSGYSPAGLTYILTNGKRMNLQVAVHDDTFHHRTNVLVGTPIITTTY